MVTVIRRFRRWLMFRLPLWCVAILLGCASPDFETPEHADLRAAGAAGPSVDGFCVRSGEQYAPSSASCYHVKAASGSVLANCFGEHSSPVTNEELTPNGPGYIVTGFEVPGGGCFYFYACDGDSFEDAAPTVEVCP